MYGNLQVSVIPYIWKYSTSNNIMNITVKSATGSSRSVVLGLRVPWYTVRIVLVHRGQMNE